MLGPRLYSRVETVRLNVDRFVCMGRICYDGDRVNLEGC